MHVRGLEELMIIPNTTKNLDEGKKENIEHVC
jgi:hypothetical protein